MKHLIIAVVLIVLTFTLAATSQQAAKTSVGIKAPACKNLTFNTKTLAFDCVSECTAVRESCRTIARGAYNHCLNQEQLPDSECRARRTTVYLDCMRGTDCRQCYDGTDNTNGCLWYCKCGKPANCKPGFTPAFPNKDPGLENYDHYEDDEAPPGYTWEGMGCDVDPEICDPTLWL